MASSGVRRSLSIRRTRLPRPGSDGVERRPGTSMKWRRFPPVHSSGQASALRGGVRNETPAHRCQTFLTVDRDYRLDDLARGDVHGQAIAGGQGDQPSAHDARTRNASSAQKRCGSRKAMMVTRGPRCGRACPPCPYGGRWDSGGIEDLKQQGLDAQFEQVSPLSPPSVWPIAVGAYPSSPFAARCSVRLGKVFVRRFRPSASSSPSASRPARSIAVSSDHQAVALADERRLRNQACSESRISYVLTASTSAASCVEIVPAPPRSAISLERKARDRFDDLDR